MENQLIGYELFVDNTLYPTSFDSSWNHKLYTSEDDAKMALKDLRNHLYITRSISSLKVCYRPVYLTFSNTGNYVLEYKNDFDFFLDLRFSKYRKRIYNDKGIQDFKKDFKPNFYNSYYIRNIKYGKPIF